MRWSLAILFLATSASVAFAQESKLPEGLKHVPADALGFVHIRTGDFLQSAVGKTLMEELRKDREAAKGLKQVEEMLGLQVADLESVTLLIVAPPGGSPMRRWDIPGTPRGPTYRKAPFDFDMKKPAIPFEKIEEKKAAAKDSPVLFQDGFFAQSTRIPGMDDLERRMFLEAMAMQGMDIDPAMNFSNPLVIMTSTKPLDRKKILRQQFKRMDGRDPFDRPGMGDPSVLFLSDRSILIGASWDLGQYSELMGRKTEAKTSPLRSALSLGAEPHLMVAGGHLPTDVRRMMFTPFNIDMRALAPIAPLLQTEAAATVDLSTNHADLRLQFTAANATSAAHVFQAAKTLRVLGELGLEKIKEGGESGGWKRDLENGLEKALAGASIDQKETTVRFQLKLELTPAVFKQVTKEFVSVLRHKGDRSASVNNLKMIGIALHGYHDTMKRFPPAGISSINDPNGKPLLSWRVAILPYIEQAPLYQQFDLTQSWDHPTNKKLISKMPSIYIVPGTDNKEGETNYRVLVGPMSMFELQPGNRGIRITDITDGTSNTIMAVEARDPTIWTRPDDLPFDPKGPLPKLGVTADGFNALFGDGTVRWFRNLPDEVLRAMITRNGGEVFEIPNER